MTDHGKSDVSNLVRVVPLMWKEQSKSHFALAIGLTYLITHDFDGWHVLIVTGREMSGIVDGVFSAIDAAKAAAQADFERSILACITTRMENE